MNQNINAVLEAILTDLQEAEKATLSEKVDNPKMFSVACNTAAEAFTQAAKRQSTWDVCWGLIYGSQALKKAGYDEEAKKIRRIAQILKGSLPIGPK